MRGWGSVAAVAVVAAGLAWSCANGTTEGGDRPGAEARRLVEGGRASLAERKYAEAAARFSRARQLQPANLDAGILEAQAEVLAGHDGRALELAMDLLAANPDEPRLGFLLAGILERRNQFAQALGALTAAQRLEEDLALIYLESARLHWRFRQVRQASAALAKASSILAPDSPLTAPVDELKRLVAGGES